MRLRPDSAEIAVFAPIWRRSPGRCPAGGGSARLASGLLGGRLLGTLLRRLLLGSALLRGLPCGDLVGTGVLGRVASGRLAAGGLRRLDAALQGREQVDDLAAGLALLRR